VFVGFVWVSRLGELWSETARVKLDAEVIGIFVDDSVVPAVTLMVVVATMFNEVVFFVAEVALIVGDPVAS